MQSPSFRIGTVVRLRSGGPAMVVVSVRGESTFCEWFDQGQKRRGEFPTAALECDESYVPNLVLFLIFGIPVPCPPLVLTPNQVHFQVEKFWFTGTSFL